MLSKERLISVSLVYPLLTVADITSLMPELTKEVLLAWTPLLPPRRVPELTGPPISWCAAEIAQLALMALLVRDTGLEPAVAATMSIDASDKLVVLVGTTLEGDLQQLAALLDADTVFKISGQNLEICARSEIQPGDTVLINFRPLFALVNSASETAIERLLQKQHNFETIMSSIVPASKAVN